MNEIILDGESLTIEQVTAVAYGKPGELRVALSESAKTKVNRSAQAVQTLLERGEIAYGITTGFGAFKNKIISRADVETLQRNIILSHAVGVGEIFDVPTTRAILLIRANTLARGLSGIRLETLEMMLEFLNRGVHPVIPSRGSLGASGDLAPLAHAALPLIGEGMAEFAGEVLNGAQALERAGLKPITLAAKEGLALTNGTTVMTALGVLGVVRAQNLKDTADIAACLTLEALNGTTAAFDERIHALRPHPRQQKCAANLREILAESDFVRKFDPTNVQDSYTLRCIPQVHGAARDSIDYAEWVFTLELNAVTDNPLIFVDDNETIEVVSGGNFHGELLALAFDYLAIALSEFGSMSERRIAKLVDSNCNGGVLPAFLTENGGLNSGFMLVQYTAAALATENKILAHPASVDTIPTSANVEDHVSMGLTAGLKLRQVCENVETIIALELFAAAQGIDCRRRDNKTECNCGISETSSLGKGTRNVYKLIRREIAYLEQDALLQPHIEHIRKLVANGKLTELE
ncbi:MAG TPA: histidine ammonia-lyase [Pyrinomonadaceae bacterium]|nr:histidine ammonia-lyase [Pyrinomonadaceae bacterium]